MKNISLTLSPGYTIAPPAPQMPGKTIPINQSYQLTIGTQFDNENEALEFASFMIKRINEFKGRNDELMGEAYFEEKSNG